MRDLLVELDIEQLVYTHTNTVNRWLKKGKTIGEAYGEANREARAVLKTLLTQRELQSRIDENDIWLAHSTSRVIDNDDKPAIRSSDFKERMSELQAQLNSLQGE